MSRIVTLMSAFVALAITGCGTTSLNDFTQPAPPRVGQLAPAFTLSNLTTNQTVTLKSLLGKKPLIVNAWASWCENCRVETPQLVALAKQYAGSITVVGVDAADNAGDGRAFAKRYHMAYLTLNDAKGTFMNDYNIQGLPTTYVMDRTGKITTIHPGVFTRSALLHLFQVTARQG